MSKKSFRITVPGSTANLGPGFDSVGMAINRYLILDVTPSNEWLFVPKVSELAGLPKGKDNLIYKVASSVAKDYGMDLLPHRVEVSSDIPLSRGLGSSAAAIVAGIELANQLLELHLSSEEKLRRASNIEGHLDNVAASLYGGLIIGSHREDGTDMVHGGYPDIDIIVYIPNYELETKVARSVLPEQMEYKQAVLASGISNVLVAALLTDNWELAGKMMAKDLFHQPYRGKLVPELEMVYALADELGAYGVALSGAGPTIICFAPKGKGTTIQKKLQERFTEARIEILKVDHEGLAIESKCMVDM
ncbi:homoserine kinase [Calidifontibacillus erzurumensis]|uniref:Homoserine kinase n=1 Tax=Calidifontibacillus erzurumensis TaxID=2741433 RepID=A0A8J8KEE3_9BACI|nr:homoserine kinase [Calidifontibacillus erzurumensis]NSL51730.1 homoserine kinase [Calidifontibacillus erzurumensis]